MKKQKLSSSVLGLVSLFAFMSSGLLISSDAHALFGCGSKRNYLVNFYNSIGQGSAADRVSNLSCQNVRQDYAVIIKSTGGPGRSIKIGGQDVILGVPEDLELTDLQPIQSASLKPISSFSRLR